MFVYHGRRMATNEYVDFTINVKLFETNLVYNI